MRTINVYTIVWDNGNASGEFTFQPFTNRRDAEAYGREWKRSMVAVEETEKARREARQEYEWNVHTRTFYVERNFEWPGHSYRVFATPQAPHAPLFKEVLWKHVIQGILDLVKKS